MVDHNLSPAALREIVHVHILDRLADLGPDGFVLKGGVNLRLFFSSIRYSEDLDIDGRPDRALLISQKVSAMFEDAELLRSLQRFGIQRLDPGEGPNKDTKTTFRYKFGVEVGGVSYPTKFEVSYRERFANDDVLNEQAPIQLAQRYLDRSAPLVLPHYSRTAMIRQKIVALARRTVPQARDVFDLHLLTNEIDETTTAELARVIAADDLQQSRRRVFEMDYAEYRDRVVEFLSESEREAWESESAWEILCLHVSEVIETLENQRGSSDG